MKILPFYPDIFGHDKLMNALSIKSDKIEIKENILKCAVCDNIKVNDIWRPNNGLLSAEQLRKECPTVICIDCRPKK